MLGVVVQTPICSAGLVSSAFRGPECAISVFMFQNMYDKMKAA